jgi:integrase
MMLLHEDGRPIARGELAAVAAAIQRRLAEIEREERQQHGPTVAMLITEFLKWHRARGSRERTIYTHKWNLRKFASFAPGGIAYGSRPASSICLDDLSAWRESLEESGWSTGTIRIAYAAVLSCWHWAARPVERRIPARILSDNPFAGLERPARGDGRKLVLPWSTINALVEFAERRSPTVYKRERTRDSVRCLALRLIAETGCRPHEAYQLRWDWLHETERAIVIPKAHTKTNREDRIIGLSREMAAALGALRLAPHAHPIWVFSIATESRIRTPRVSRFDSWFRDLKAAAAKASPPIILPDGTTPYTLRHSFITHAKAVGIDLRRLADGMGHSAAVAESVYNHPQVNDITKFMDEVRERRSRAG